MLETPKNVEPAPEVPSTPSPPKIEAPAPNRSTRDQAIDVLRGLCIVSMTTAHLAAGSWPWQITHAAIYVDGAVGFVFLSGVVLGITQHRTIDRSGLLAGERKLLRRIGLIYCAHLALCVLAFSAVAVNPVRAADFPGIESIGGPAATVMATLTLQVNPHYIAILSLYVVLLILSVGAIAGLENGRAGLVLAASVGLYTVGYFWPAVFTFSIQPGVPGAVNWASWQLLFFIALLVGWNWRTDPVRRMLASRSLLILATGLVLIAAAAGWVITRGPRTPWGTVVGRAFTEGTLAPGTILMALAAILVGYRISRVLVRVAQPVVAPLARIGRHSLDCYLILCAGVIIVPGLFSYDRSGWVAVGVTFDVLVLMWLWSFTRDRMTSRLSPDAPS